MPSDSFAFNLSFFIHFLKSTLAAGKLLLTHILPIPYTSACVYSLLASVSFCLPPTFLLCLSENTEHDDFYPQKYKHFMAVCWWRVCISPLPTSVAGESSGRYGSAGMRCLLLKLVSYIVITLLGISICVFLLPTLGLFL